MRHIQHPELRLAASLLMLFALAGCDVSPYGGPRRAVGMVIDKETREPLAGIYVSFQTGGGRVGGTTAVAEGLTDADGRFDLKSEIATNFYVNYGRSTQPSRYPLNLCYSGGLIVTLEAGRDGVLRGVIELQRRNTLPCRESGG